MKRFFRFIFIFLIFINLTGFAQNKESTKSISPQKTIENGENISIVKYLGEGGCRTVAGNENNAYVANGIYLDIIDITNSSNLTIMSRVSLPGGIQDIFLSVNLVYVASQGYGFAVVDVTDPNNPRILYTDYSVGNGEGIYVSGNYAYLSTGNGLNIYDVSEPSNIFKIASYSKTGLSSGKVFVSGNYAYLVDYNNGFLIIDINDPSNPSEKGSFLSAGTTGDIHVCGNYVYLACGQNGGKIIDISNPYNPVEAASFESGIWTPGIFVNGSILYVASGGNNVKLFDISDPLNPVAVKTIEGNSIKSAWDIFISGTNIFIANYTYGLSFAQITSYDPFEYMERDEYQETWGGTETVAVSGNYACIGTHGNGMWILDVNDPANPTKAADFGGDSYIEGIFISGNYVYLAADHLRIVDISDINNPQEAGVFDLDHNFNGLEVIGNYIYAVTSHKLFIIDISDKSNPIQIGVTEYESDNHNFERIFISGSYAYITDKGSTWNEADDYDGLIIIDICDPSIPVQAAYFQTEDDAIDVKIENNLAYITTFAHYPSGNNFKILDVNDPTNPFEISTMDINARYVCLSGKYAYLSSGGITAVDISDPINPVEIEYCTSNNYNGIYVKDNYIYQCAFEDGFYIFKSDLETKYPETTAEPEYPSDNVTYTGQISNGECWAFAVKNNLMLAADGGCIDIVDISDPGNPVKFSDIDFIERVTGIKIYGNYAYAGLGKYGLRIIDISDLNNPYKVGFFNSEYNIKSFQVAGDYVYLSDNDFKIIDIRDKSNPQEVGKIIGKYSDWLFKSGNYVYETSDTGEMRIINVSVPTNPAVVKTKDTGTNITGFYITGNYAYALYYYSSENRAELKVFDISSNSDFLETASYNFSTNNPPTGLFVSGDYVYYCDNGGYFNVIDFSNMSNPVSKGQVYAFAHNTFIQGNYAYVTSRYWGVQILDIHDLSNISVTGSYDTGGGFSDVYVSGDYAYTSNNGDGLSIIDVSNPYSPEKISECCPNWANAVEVKNNYAYIGSWNGLNVVDITNPTNPFVAGSYNLNETVNDVKVSGDYAYLANDTDGLRILDISDVSDITEIGNSVTGGKAKGIFISGDYVYIADGTGGLKVFNVLNPAFPVSIGSLDTGGDAEDIFVRGNYAYIANGSNGLRIINVTNPSNPVEIGSVSISGTARGIKVSGNYAYLSGDFGIKAFDIGNPSNPIPAGYNDIPLEGYGLFADGGYIYVADNHGGLKIFRDENYTDTAIKTEHYAENVSLVGRWAKGGNNVTLIKDNFLIYINGATVEFADISNVSNPVKVSEIKLPSINTDMQISGDYLYVVNKSYGMYIINITDPANSLICGNYYYDTSPGWVFDFYVSGNYAYLGRYGWLQIIDISDPANPVKIGDIEYGEGNYNPFVLGKYAYIAAEQTGLIIYDISSPSSPVMVGLFSMSEDIPYEIYVSGNYAFLACNSGLKIIDIRDPSNPYEVGSFNGNANDVFVKSNYAYIVGSEFKILNISNPANPYEIGSLDIWGDNIFIENNYAGIGGSGYTGIVDVSNPADPAIACSIEVTGNITDIKVSGNYAYAGTWNGLKVFDITNKSNPVEIKTYKFNDWIPALDLYGNYAFVAFQSGNLSIFDISDPNNLIELGTCNTSLMGVTNITINGDYAFVSNEGTGSYEAGENDGMSIINISDKNNPVETAFFETPGDVRETAIYSEYAVLAVYGYGLKIVDISDKSNPVESGSFYTGTEVRGLDLMGSIVYLVDNQYIRIIDITNPQSPAEVNNCSLRGPGADVSVVSGTAYVSEFDYGMEIIDVTDNSSPFSAGYFYTGDWSNKIYVRNNYIFLMSDGSGLYILKNDLLDESVYDIGSNYDSENVTLLGRWGYGVCTRVAVHENLAFYQNGTYLEIADVSDPSNPIKLSDIEFFSSINDIEIEGDYVYVANNWKGLKIINVEDPANPYITGSYDMSDAQDISISGTTVYAANGSEGLFVIDISNPVNPTKIKEIDITGSLLSIDISGNYAYTASSTAFYIFNIIDPGNPELMSSFLYNYNNNCRIFAEENYVYIANMGEGLSIIDVTNKTNPVEIGVYKEGETLPGGELRNYIYDVYVRDDIAYLAHRYAGITGINVSDKSNPVKISESFSVECDGHGISISGTYAYLADSNFGLRILDISNIYSLTEIALIRHGSPSLNLSCYGKYGYLCNGYGLRILDVSNPSYPRTISIGNEPNWTADVCVSGNYAYLTDGYHTMRILDISDPSQPSESGYQEIVDFTVDFIDVVENTAYLLSSSGELILVDVSNPSNPVKLGSYNSGIAAYDIDVSGDYAYITDDNGLKIIDISDPENPFLIGLYNTSSRANNIFVVGNKAYITSENLLLMILEISNPSNPSVLSSISGYAEKIYVEGNYAYVCSNGLKVIDVSDPENPTEVGHHITEHSRGIFVSGNRIYLILSDLGLHILRNDLAKYVLEEDDYGDISNDGVITAYDGALLMRYQVGLYNFANTERDTLAADVSGSGSLSSYDAALIFNYLVGNITAFPAESGNKISSPDAGKSDRKLILGKKKTEGNTIIVPVFIENVNNFASLDMEIGFDNDNYELLEIRKSEDLEFFSLIHNVIENKIRISSAGPDFIEQNGKVFELVFKVKEDLAVETDLELTIDKIFINEDNISIEIIYENKVEKIVVVDYKLYNNYPNPFNPETTIKYDLKETSKVTLKIYNILGQEIKTLISTTQKKGKYKAIWDGKNNHGIKVSSGIYIYRIKAGNFVDTKKMIFLK